MDANRIQAAERPQTPWWAWAAPAGIFLLFLVLFWPRPFAIPFGGDNLLYFDGARHIAENGRYESDLFHKPAVPEVLHAPLFPLIWGGLMRTGLSAESALFVLHAFFLSVLGAVGGTLAYQITRSWKGPLIWIVLSGFWPGGYNWVLWVRPMTETGSTAVFIVVVWMLSHAIQTESTRSWTWVIGASALAGLSAAMKIIGIFSFPAIGVVSLALALRRNSRVRWWLPIGVVPLLILPHAIWCIRNWFFVGAVEVGRPSHSLAAMEPLMKTTSAAILSWILPLQWAEPLNAAIPPGWVIGGLTVAALLLGFIAWRHRKTEAMLGSSIALIGCLTLTGLMTSRFTEESRYWATFIPCLALPVLAIPNPNSRLGRCVFRTVGTLFLLFCCARFAVSYRTLWYETTAGFYVQQIFLVVALVGGLHYLQSVIRGGWNDEEHWSARMTAIVLTVPVAVVFWRYAEAVRPWIVYSPLIVVAVVLVGLPWRTRYGMVKVGLLMAAFGTAWQLGQWSTAEIQPSRYKTYARNGVLMEVPPSVIRAREWVAVSAHPSHFASNIPEHFSDLFGNDSLVSLPECRSFTELRAPSMRSEADRSIRLKTWLDELDSRKPKEPFVVIYTHEAPHRSYYCSPAELEDEVGLTTKWIVREPDLEIALVQPPSANENDE